MLRKRRWADKDGMTDLVHVNLRMFFNIMKNASKVAKIINLGSGAEYTNTSRSLMFVRKMLIRRCLLMITGFASP